MVSPSNTAVSEYPTSTLSPAFTVQDQTKDMVQVDAALMSSVSSQLTSIARKIEELQNEAREVIERARVHRELHKAKCSFPKRVGKVYHLYRKDENNESSAYFSMMSVEDWKNNPPHTYLGSYRLEYDSSWTPVQSIQNGAEFENMLRILGLDNNINSQLIKDSKNISCSTD
eukprot:CFRG3293T1